MKLFNNIPELEQYVSISSNIELSELQPYIDSALSLIRFYAGVTAVDEALKSDSGKESLRPVVAPLAVMAATHEKSLKFGAMGHTVSSGEKVSIASDKKVEAYRESCKQRGYTALEAWMQTHVQDTSRWFGWADLGNKLGLIVDKPCLVSQIMAHAIDDAKLMMCGTISDAIWAQLESDEDSPELDQLRDMVAKLVTKLSFMIAYPLPKSSEMHYTLQLSDRQMLMIEDGVKRLTDLVETKIKAMSASPTIHYKRFFSAIP